MDSKNNSMELLKNPFANKGLGFSAHERKEHALNGLLPALVLNIKQQSQLIIENINAKSSELEKYVYLMEIYSKNIKLFFYTVINNLDELLPYIYTPTVGTACLNFGKIYDPPKGLFISIDDVNQMESIFKKWTSDNIKAICVTDGERILGLGDLGVHGMGIPIGKLALYTALGGVDPNLCLPITLDVGTNNESLLKSDYYLGMKKSRIALDKYEVFMDRFMETCTKVYGDSLLIQFEDFGNHNAFHFLQKYRTSYCMFNDDIQGTAAVVLAGIISAMRYNEKQVSQNKFLFYGAGEASLGVASLLVMLMEEDGLNNAEARKLIYMIDSKGLIVHNRPKGGLTSLKLIFAQDMAPIDSLLEVVKKIEPTVLIGASAQKGAFDMEILTEIGKNQNKPLIMALSNPTMKSECTAEEAYKYTNGNVIFASGSPFNPVIHETIQYCPGQANNAYIFPGIAFAIIHTQIKPIHDKLFLEAAKALSRKVTEVELSKGCIYPSMRHIREVSLAVAFACCDYAYRYGMAHYKPEPMDKMTFLSQRYFMPRYDAIAASKPAGK